MLDLHKLVKQKEFEWLKYWANLGTNTSHFTAHSNRATCSTAMKQEVLASAPTRIEPTH